MTGLHSPAPIMHILYVTKAVQLQSIVPQCHMSLHRGPGRGAPPGGACPQQEEGGVSSINPPCNSFCPTRVRPGSALMTVNPMTHLEGRWGDAVEIHVQ